MQQLCPSARLLDDILGKGGPKKPLRDSVIAHRTDVAQLAAADSRSLTNIKKALAGQYDAPIGLDLVPANQHIQEAQAPRSIRSSLSNRLNTADEELVLSKAQQILKDRLKQVAEEEKTFLLLRSSCYTCCERALFVKANFCAGASARNAGRASRRDSGAVSLASAADRSGSEGNQMM